MSNHFTPGATTRPCGRGVCRSNPGCEDVYCEGHPVNEVTDEERDPVALRWLLACYCGFIATCLVAIAYADDIYHWLTK